MATVRTSKQPARHCGSPSSENGAEPKISELGLKLREIRAKAVTEGLRLCTAEEIEKEIDEMRGRTEHNG